MIKFEEHDDRLFRMLDKPVPLTPDAEMPCLVRLIQDDSPMGRYNRDAAYFDVIGKLFVAQNIKENPFYSNTLHAYEKNSLNQDYCIASIHTLEIIGYQAEEGSRWWALYQMMQGEKICHHKSPSIRYLDQNKRVCLVSKNGDVYQGAYSPEDWLYYVESTNCWEIYEEPKPEPAKEQFEVGDWVEWCGDQYMVESAPPQSGGRYDIRSPYDELGCSVYPENITRKLSPSEVIVHIGCLSGTVRCCDNENICPESTPDNPCHFVLQDQITGFWSIIYFKMLDTHTLELVGSLLKAQEVKK